MRYNSAIQNRYMRKQRGSFEEAASGSLLMDSDVSFGSWLKQRRKALDMTQADLARQVGCAAITIRKIESRRAAAALQIARRMAGILI